MKLVLAAALAVAALAGCPSAKPPATNRTAAPPPVAAGPALPAGALPVPIIPQSTSYSCGPAALLGVLYYWQAFDGHERDLWTPLGTTEKDGTEPQKLEQVAQAHGLKADYHTDVTVEELRAALARRETVILDLQAWQETPHGWIDDWDDGHYVVLVGLDADYLYAMDPSAPAGYAYLPLPELLDRWHDEELHAGGKKLRRQHPAILISGQAPLPALPGPLQRML